MVTAPSQDVKTLDASADMIVNPVHPVDSSTKSTTNPLPNPSPDDGNVSPDNPDKPIQTTPQTTPPTLPKIVQQDLSPILPTMPNGPGEPSTAVDPGSEREASAASLPAVPSPLPAAQSPLESTPPSSVVRSRSTNDSTVLATSPAGMADSEGSGTPAHLEDILTSPHGNNDIAERSPGGRYVRFMEKLGSGASKDVYRAYDTQEGIEVAWNVVHLAGVQKNERNRIVNEVRLLERLHHHNIISFHGSWVNREKQQVNFVTEILSSGTLKSFINKVQVIRWKIAKRWAIQILTGLQYLHSQEPMVIHRDLKCENIFINGTSGDLRIGDLGLSTVHRNGKALSVLGTPEFMAPDMYEENAYDEKVDIYAFGMCLLEIFTKEIPYRECSNPAQIYKKVTRGDPPNSLRRLKSRHAREFIELCLGSKDEEGKYHRPSATELLSHPFLQQRPSDDDVVEVDPPVQERTIQEVSETSSSDAKGISRSAPSHSSQQGNVSGTTKSSSPRTKLERSTNSLDDEESIMDRFDEMPDRETSIRDPIILVGRDLKLHRDEKSDTRTNDHLPTNAVGEGQAEQSARPQQVAAATQSAIPVAQPPASGAGSVAQVAPIPQQITAEQQGPTPVASPASALHYLVAVAVIEDEQKTGQPYADDNLKLVVTLPVGGQTQNVFFNFHLVEDDPIQVAKEMVAELDVPQAAVLEISETISGLARAARVKQDRYIAKMGGHSRSHSQVYQQQTVPPQPVGHGMMPSQGHQSVPDFSTVTAVQTPHVTQPLHQQTMAPQEQPQQIQSQQLGQHSSVPPLHVQPQHQHLDSVASRPVAPQVTQHVGLPDKSIQGTQNIPGQTKLQPNWNPGISQNGPPTSSQLIHNPPVVRNVSSQGPSDVPGTTYGQLPLQPAPQQQNQSGNQPILESQGQAPASYGHSSQPAVVQGQPGSQATGQVAGSQVPAVPQYAQQNQSHSHAPVPVQPVGQGVQLQGNGTHGGNNFQPQPEQQSQIQYMQPQTHSQSQGLSQPHQIAMPQQPQVPPPAQQMHVVQQGGPIAPQQAPISVPQPVPQVTQPQQLPHQQQPIVQQAPPPHQSIKSHQTVQGPGVPVQIPANVSSQAAHQIGLSSGPSNIPSKVETPAIAPKPQPPNRVGGQEEASVIGTSNATQPSAGSGVAVSTDTHVNGVHGVPSVDDDALDELLAAELRKLDEDFKKNMMRAQKVFDTRMDNLQRSKSHREAQHLKTLEKHEKEKADFEKRMHHESIEQNRRIEMLQKDWAIRREQMRQKTMEAATLDVNNLSLEGTGEMDSIPDVGSSSER